MAKSAADYRASNRDKSTQLQVLAATGDTTFIAPKSANHQIFVQKITVGITTYAAQTWTFQDTNGTPVPIYHISIPGAAVALPSESNGMTIDFGAKGFGLTIGASLALNVSAAGAAGAVTVEAYEVLANTVAVASTN